MKCKYCNAELTLITIKEMEMAFCCKEWQIKPESIRPKVKEYIQSREKSGN